MSKFGTDVEKTTRRHLRPGDAHELTNRHIVAPGLRQHVTQQPIGQTFHRCQQNPAHGVPGVDTRSIEQGVDVQIAIDHRLA